ncbi:MAG: Rpn family recombination-promoting nuclease/putative transposase, partial [Clostridia bacterium]|nr:Rpn family recombination-promoting nuclease/putative transposase [Clostridia bacterium]
YIVNENRVVKVTYDRDLLGTRKDWLQNNDKDRKSELNEEQENYKILTNKDVNNKHDKTYRSILDSKKDATYIINQVLNLEQEIKQDEIEKYNSSFVTNDLQNKEADIVYKMKEKNIFFLIEHQSKVDYSMPYRIEEYRLEIIKSAIDVKKIKNKGYEMPEVIPIVIYTGKGQWNAKLYLHSISDERFKNVNLQRYNLIDINNYEEETLMKSNYLIDKMFLIEKAEGQEDTQRIIIQAVETTKDEQDKAKLIKIIKATLMKQVDKVQLEEIIKNKKGEVEVMEEVIERLKLDAIKRGLQQGIQQGIQQGLQQGMQEGKRKGKREGIKETIRNIVNNMLQKGIEEDEIKELTGATKREIEQIKKQLNKE